MKPKGLVFAGVAAAVVVLDQITKAWIESSLALHESLPVVEGVFHLTYVRNPGAAFGMFSSSGELFRRVLFLVVAVVALAIIYYAFRRVGGVCLTLVGLALVFGGAVGNLIDRVRWGEVVDFLDFFWRTHHWPAFNVADSAITIGVSVLLFDELVRKGLRRT